MRGRLQGVFIVVVAGGPRLGDLESGAAASFLSLQGTVLSGGIAVLVGVAVLAAAVPSFRRYQPNLRDEPHSFAAAEEAEARITAEHGRSAPYHRRRHCLRSSQRRETVAPQVRGGARSGQPGHACVVTTTRNSGAAADSAATDSGDAPVKRCAPLRWAAGHING